MGKVKIRKELKDHINELYHAGISHSRKQEKDCHNWSPYIHSRATRDTYMQHIDPFADWCAKQGVKYSDQTDMKSLIAGYTNELIAEGKSAWTVRTVLSALCKASGYRTADISVELPKRQREAIKRSRQAVERDRHINPEHYKTLYIFERCFGLRHHKELETVSAASIRDDEKALYCTVVGKGGKERTVKAYGTPEEIGRIRRHIELNQSGALFSKGDIPSGFDAHALRAEYASRVYHAHARKEVLPEDRYICRNDKAGEVYDKKALAIVSKMLGHNRLCVVVDNYSYRF